MTQASVDWAEVCGVVGPCTRPGGTGLTERALACCDLGPEARVADIGCGAGGSLEHLGRSRDYRLVGIDPSPIQLELAGARLGSSHLVQGRAEALPFQTESFDALLCECVLSVVDDRHSALGEFARVLKQGGYLLLSDVFAETTESKAFLSRRSLDGALRDLGFTVLLWEEHRKVLREFIARTILAGKPLPYSGCKGGPAGRDISYFLLTARKEKRGLG